MRTVVIGAVESTAVTLRALARAGLPPLAVVTLPLAKASRHSDFYDLRPLVRELGVGLVEAEQVNDPGLLDRIRALELDCLFVIGWSQIVKPALLAAPRRGAIGFHPALLPDMRGRAVIPWTILLRRRVTGATLFWIDEGVDSGDILAQEGIDVDVEETAASLMAKHLGALGGMLDRVLPALARGEGPRSPQDHSRATWCARRTAADGWIDWSLGCDDVAALIRAVGSPYPGAFTTCRGRRLVVWSAKAVPDSPYFGLPGQVQELTPAGALVACGRGLVLARDVQLETEPVTPAHLVLKRHERLGEVPGARWIGGPPATAEGRS